MHWDPCRDARLDGTGQAWCAGRPFGEADGSQWLQITLPEPTCVVGVATKGRRTMRQWVTEYVVTARPDSGAFSPVGTTFAGNDDMNTTVTQSFAGVLATDVRLSVTRAYSAVHEQHPQQEGSRIAMRADVITCQADTGVDCAGAWGACDCAVGRQYFFVTTPARGTGAACEFAPAESRDCEDLSACPPTTTPAPPAPTCDDAEQNGDEHGIDCGGSCPACADGEESTDCVGSWDLCSVSCGDGVQTYRVETPTVGAGAACDYGAGDTRSCHRQTCPETSDRCDSWCAPRMCAESWFPTYCGGCPATMCGGDPNCSDGAQNGDEAGVDCGGSCSTACPPEPLDCQGAWGPCSVTCGHGIQHYTITAMAEPNGAACDASDDEHRSCEMPACDTRVPEIIVSGRAYTGAGGEHVKAPVLADDASDWAAEA